MFRLGIIEESLEDRQVLEIIKPYFVSQRIENVLEDEYPIWHTNEYHIGDEKIFDVLEVLKNNIKTTWYIHAFNKKTLYVVLKSKWFEISLHKDKTWEEMIEYGVNIAKVERRYLENVPLYI